MHKLYDLWTTHIEVHDNYITDNTVYQQLISESFIDNSIDGQNVCALTRAQNELKKNVTLSVIGYCQRNEIDYNNLSFTELQKGCLYKYDNSKVGDHLYEPHHDMVEGSFITAIYYIDSSYNEQEWCGGELTIYKNLTFAEYPNNSINILPKQNRLVILPGFNVHRVKPYFGNKPRTAFVFGWVVIDQPLDKPIIF